MGMPERNLPDFDLSSCLSWWSLSVRPWRVSTKLWVFVSGVKHCKFTILFMFGIDPLVFIYKCGFRYAVCTHDDDDDHDGDVFKMWIQKCNGKKRREEKSARMWLVIPKWICE